MSLKRFMCVLNGCACVDERTVAGAESHMEIVEAMVGHQKAGEPRDWRHYYTDYSDLLYRGDLGGG